MHSYGRGQACIEPLGHREYPNYRSTIMELLLKMLQNY